MSAEQQDESEQDVYAALNRDFQVLLRRQDLIIELDRNWLTGQHMLRLKVPGKTAKSKPVQALPVIVAAPGQTHVSMLIELGEAMGQARAETEQETPS